MIKEIKKSARGLTFRFKSAGKLTIGSHYDYIIDKQAKTIRIIPNTNGKLKVSRKRAKDGWDSLIDLRSKEVLAAIGEMEQIRVSIRDDLIVISDAARKGGGQVLAFPRLQLRELRAAAGISATEAAQAITENVQLTFSDLFAADVNTIHEGLADVYTLVSLFSGAGILDWPFANDDRFKLLYAIDYDKAACETYRRNIGTHIVHGDIHKAFTEEGYPLDDTVESPSVIIGGPSCKPFSNANRHTRLEDHPDSDLVLQYLRIVEKLRPKVWAMENVPAVLTACDGAYFDAIRNMAKRTGYDVASRIVEDVAVGGYTTRKRAIVIGSRIGPARFCDLVPADRRTAGDALSKVDASWSNFHDVTVPGEETRRRMSFVRPGHNYEDIPEEYRTASKNRHSCTYRRLALDEPAPTIVNWRKPPLIHPTEDRTLTVAEAKALQGLPGHFRICGTLSEMQQQVGNSVPVAIGDFIKRTLLAMLGDRSTTTYANLKMAGI